MKRNLEFAVAMFTLARFLCNFPHAEWRNWIGILCEWMCVQVVSCLMIIAYVAWRRKVGLRFSHEACVQQGVGAKLWERKNVLRVNMVKVRLQLKVGLLMLCETNKSFSFPRPTFTIYSSCSSRHQYFLKSSRRSQLAFHVPTTSKIL